MMKAKVFAIVLATSLCSSLSWAGILNPVPTRAPLMDEGGLVLLALALAGTGVSLLRRNKR